MARDCHDVVARGSRTWFSPCGASGVCGPDDVSAWNDAARGWVAAVEAESKSPEQREWAAVMRQRFNALDGDVPAPWSMGDRVNDYMLIAQQISCALVPIWQRQVDDERKKAAGGEDDGPPAAEDDEGWFSWVPDLPSLPGLPSWPGLPSLPSWPTWPTIPPWVWWVAGGLLVLYVWPKDRGR